MSPKSDWRQSGNDAGDAEIMARYSLRGAIREKAMPMTNRPVALPMIIIERRAAGCDSGCAGILHPLAQQADLYQTHAAPVSILFASLVSIKIIKLAFNLFIPPYYRMQIIMVSDKYEGTVHENGAKTLLLPARPRIYRHQSTKRRLSVRNGSALRAQAATSGEIFNPF